VKIRNPTTLYQLAYRNRRLRRSLRQYVSKFSGTAAVAPPRPSVGHAVIAWIGALITLSLLGWLSEVTKAPLILASFGASCVLLFGYPDSPFSQPRNTIGGHLIAAATGLACHYLLGDHWSAMALAVATSIAFMKMTKSVHPPAGSTAIIAVYLHPNYSFILLPVLVGSSLLVVMAAFYNNVIEHRRYPLYWW
jgi:CBS-domain-containing membrane protein